MTCKGKKVVIDDKEYVLDEPKQEQHEDVVLLRTQASGVHVGHLVKRTGDRSIQLSGATRVWRWKGANTLSELSQKGGDIGYTRISEAVPTIELLDVLEIIPCSVEGAKNLLTSRWPA